MSRSSSAAKRPRRGLRRAARILLAFATLVLLLCTALLLSLRSSAVRGAVLDWAKGTVARSAGLHVEARDFDVSLLAGEIGLSGIELRSGAMESRPFLTIPGARARLSWRSLLSDRPRIHWLRLEHPVLDLAAPLPSSEKSADAESSPLLPALDIDRFELSGGVATSGEASTELDTWFDAWRVDSAALSGSLAADSLVLRVERAEIVLESHRRADIAMDLGAKLSVTADGDVTVEGLSLLGDGLDLQLEGRGRMGNETSPFSIDLEVDLGADLARLVPDLTTQGSVESRGEVTFTAGDAPGLVADLLLDGRDFPAELLQPLLPESDWGELKLAGTQLDVDADLDARMSFAPATADPAESQVSGRMTATWRRQEEPLVVASIETLEPVAAEGTGVSVAVDLSILPTIEGARELHGRLSAPGWNELAELEIEEVRLEIEQSDLQELMAGLGITDAAFGDFRPVGGVTLRATAAGPIDAPDFELEGAWRLEEHSLVELEVTASAGSRLAVSGQLLSDSPGVREIEGVLVSEGLTNLYAGSLEEVRLQIDLPDVAATLGTIDGLLRKILRDPEAVERARLKLGGFEPAGRLTLSATTDGPVNEPNLELDGSWSLGDRRLLELSVGPAETSGLHFETRLLGDSPGVRAVAGEIDLARSDSWREGLLEGIEIGVEIDEPDLAETLTTMDELMEAFFPDPERRSELLAALSPEVRERLTGSLHVELSAQGPLDRPAADLTADLKASLEGEWRPSDSEHLTLALALDRRRLTLSDLVGSLSLDGLTPKEEPLRFAARGQVQLESPLRNAMLDLQLLEPLEDIRRLDIAARLEGGTLILESSTPEIPGRLRSVLPLAPLSELLRAPEGWTDLPLIFDSGPLELEIRQLDLTAVSAILLSLADAEAAKPEIEGQLDARLVMHTGDPRESVGALEVAGLRVSLDETRVESDQLLRLELAEGHLTLGRTRFRAIRDEAESAFDLEFAAILASGWEPRDGVDALFESSNLDLAGTIDASLMTPFLGGGVAAGPLTVTANAQGTLDDLEARLRLSGADARVVLPGRYRTSITAPEIVLTADESGFLAAEARMGLNRGELRLTGQREEDDVVSLSAEVDGVRYRLDYGLTVLMDAAMVLRWPPDGRPRLTGTVDVERGSLRRNLSLERELLRFFEQSELAGATSPLLRDIDLDLSLVTREGVRIKNNLADLRVDWDRIRVRGTLAQPTIAGRIDVDPGGFLTAYGQTVRIDQGALDFSGVPGEPPRADFETTSSAEDPRLRDQWNSVWSTGPATRPGDSLWDRAAGSSGFQADELTESVSEYFKNRFLQTVTGRAPRIELSLQPLPLMGETDTTARVTMSYHLSPQVSYVLSQNPREAEGRTDILNLHNFAVAPSLQAQLFRNDQGHQGATLQQMLEFGGGKGAEDSLPRLQRIELLEPRTVSKRSVRRATGLRRGERVSEGADFDIEIDMLDAMARRGYPAANVEVVTEPAPRNRVRVDLVIEPGPRVEFEFSGDRPSRRARRDIMALYQPTGMEESPALESVRRDTTRALQAQGFLEPEVVATTERLATASPPGHHIIRVHGVGGRRVNPLALEWPGLPEEVGSSLVGVFSTRLSRVELATSESVADALFSQSMQALGFPEAVISKRELSPDGSALVVEVEPGPRRTLAAVEIGGVESELLEELEAILPLGPGDPVRSDQITRAAFQIEDLLRDRGFADAEVRARSESSEQGQHQIDLSFDVTLGQRHTIAQLRTQGLTHSSPDWVERVSGLEPGELLTDSGLSTARRRLARTGVFQRIAIRREEREAPVQTGEDTMETPITLELVEHPRYRVAYGLRAESTREMGAVADISDLNFLGRGHTLGLRAIYGTLERNLRLYWAIPRVRQSEKNLEFFLEARREELGEVVGDTGEAWAQLTFPVGERSVHRFYTVYQQSVTEDRSTPERPPQRVTSPFSGWQVSYDTGERSLFETSTEKNTLFVGSDLSFASEDLGSDFTGYGLFAQLKPQIPLVRMGGSALVWVQNYRGGLKEAQGDAELPFFDRLFAGGEYSVRGYPTNSLGPLGEDGPLGGEAMFVMNQELRFPIWTLVSGVAFFDAGNVWASRREVDWTLFTAVGAGLRADSPVGPLRLDLAFPLNRREGDSEYEIYFGLGHSF